MICKNPFQLPFVPYQDKQSLPEKPGIYYLLNRQLNQIIYVGRSQNIRQRWASHHRNHYGDTLTGLYPDAVVIAWELHLNEQLEHIEKEAINLHSPLLNYQGADDSFDILYENWWEDSFEYNQNLVEAFSNPKLSNCFLETNTSQQQWRAYQVAKTSQQQWRAYQVAKTNLIEILNYPHLITKQPVPVYRRLEFTWITYVTHADEMQDFANNLYGVGNQDIKEVLHFFSVEIANQEDERPALFKKQLNEDETVLGLATLLADLSLADVKAHQELFPEADFWSSVFASLEESDSKTLMLDLTDPSTHGYIGEQWERLLGIAWEDLEGQSKEDIEGQST